MKSSGGRVGSHRDVLLVSKRPIRTGVRPGRTYTSVSETEDPPLRAVGQSRRVLDSSTYLRTFCVTRETNFRWSRSVSYGRDRPKESSPERCGRRRSSRTRPHLYMWKDLQPRRGGSHVTSTFKVRERR